MHLKTLILIDILIEILIDMLIEILNALLIQILFDILIEILIDIFRPSIKHKIHQYQGVSYWRPKIEIQIPKFINYHIDAVFRRVQTIQNLTPK